MGVIKKKNITGHLSGLSGSTPQQAVRLRFDLLGGLMSVPPLLGARWSPWSVDEFGDSIINQPGIFSWITPFIYIFIINLLLPILIRISMEHIIMLENPDLKTKRWTRVSHGITAGDFECVLGMILWRFTTWIYDRFQADVHIFCHITEQNRQSLWDTETPSEKQTVSRTVTAWKKAIDFVGQRLAHPVFQWIGGEFPSISLQQTLCDVDGYRFLFGKDWIFASSKAKFHPTSQSCGRPCNATVQPFINPTNIGV